jgi:hypothetical protein
MLSKSNMLLVTSRKYLFLTLTAGISSFVSFVLIGLNLFLGFSAYTIIYFVKNLKLSQYIGENGISFMSVFEWLYFGNPELVRAIFITIGVLLIIFSFSAYKVREIEKRVNIESLTEQYFKKIEKSK